MKLPDSIDQHPDVQQTYGEAANHVRGVYSGRIGWFDGDPASIHPPSFEIEAQRVVDAFGGTDACLKQIDDAVQDGELAWAARIGQWLMAVEPENSNVRTTHARTLRLLGQSTTAWTIRNYYLSHARDLEGSVSIQSPTHQVDPRAALSTPPGTFVRGLAYRANPLKFPDSERILRIRFVDCDHTCALILRRGVAEYRESLPGHISPDCTVSLTREHWITAVYNAAIPADGVAGSDVVCDPDDRSVRMVLESFD